MNLECLGDIIRENLAIHIDLTDIKSWWNYNTGLTAISLTKWNKAKSDNINLMDFGLTEFDNGRTDLMWKGINLTPKDVYLSMYPVGYNIIKNPTNEETSGMTINTVTLPLKSIASGDTETYQFELSGGYLQGFFKLQDYNYELFSSRYGKGITIETILYINPNSSGIFYMMGARAEDKYNPYFSGETTTGTTYSGVITSDENYLDAIMGKEVYKKSFRLPEENKETIYSEISPNNNINNNTIAFELTDDLHLDYKYVDGNGSIISNSSPYTVTATGFTMIDIVFMPYEIIIDESKLECKERRLGNLIFYVNGRSVWTVKDFPEYYFHGFSNDKEKQIGVPYSISWGGGSFGLENSYHYDFQKYMLYSGQSRNYIDNNFIVKENNLVTSALILSADSSTFTDTVMRVEYSGGTGNTYLILFNREIATLSNRDYTVNVSIFDDGFFKNVDNFGGAVINKITLLPFSVTTDIGVVDETDYVYPISMNGVTPEQLGLHPFPDRHEYEYIYIDKKMYYGANGYPVYDEFGNINTNDAELIAAASKNSIYVTTVTGQGDWKDLKTVFRTEENSGLNLIKIGILIETSEKLNIDKPLFVSDFNYVGSDILVKDIRKNNMLIEQNFNDSFIGGIQKLRIYDNALSSSEVLHNAIIESRINPNILVTKGGRIIYR